MNHKKLNPIDHANSSQETPWLWLGTWSLGGHGFGPVDERESIQVLQKAFEKGIVHFDTAGFYARGQSERLLARALQNHRRQIFISTKGGLVWEGNFVQHRGGKESLKQALCESLKRLKTGYIDLFQLHWPDPAIPLNESIKALISFQKEGLIRFWGVGNLNSEQVETYITSDANVPHQVHFNPIHKTTKSVLTTGHSKNRCLNCIVSPLEQGLLTEGRSSLGLEALGNRDIRRRNPYFRSDEIRSWLLQLDELCKTTKIPKVNLILLWILSQRGVDVLIPGPKTLNQLQQILETHSWIKQLGLTQPSENHHLQWQELLITVVGQELWAHLDS